MSARTVPVAALAAVLSLAGCQSVHTQSATPTLEQPVSLRLTTETPLPAASPTASGTPAASLPAKPASAKHSYNRVEGVGRTVAITFDDGPSPKLTPALLDILKARGIRATFYVVGQNAAAHPEILQRMVAEGHEVANHSWNHPALTKLGAAGVESQITRTNAAIKAAIGRNPTTMRPPYGATNAALNRRLDEQYGLKVILWDVDPLDWKYRNAARVQRAIVEGTRPGSIILVHDIHPSSVAAMPGTLDALLAKGYKFVPVAELIAMEGTVAPVAVPSATPTPEPSSVVTAPTPTAAASPAASPFRVEPYASPTP